MDLEDGGDDEEDWASEEEDVVEEPARTRILTVDELEALFLEKAPSVPASHPNDASQHDRSSDSQSQNTSQPSRKIQIGLVGYPNVGKSSTINTLLGQKKVSVSATPGKTKHFQTIHLSPSVILCDCPGLVFPNFATTKAELVCNGILPIDQLREYLGPAGLVARRIPRSYFEAAYGVKVKVRSEEEGGVGVPTAEEMLSAYARARGYATTGMGMPDIARAARYVLKDYMNGKLLWAMPPPREPAWDERQFNRQLYDPDNLPGKRRARQEVDELARVGELDSEGNVLPVEDHAKKPIDGVRSRGLDKSFFGAGAGDAGHLSRPFNYKYSEQGSGKVLSGRKERAMVALEKGVDPSEVKMMGNGKKHFKGGKKTREKKTKDDDDF